MRKKTKLKPLAGRKINAKIKPPDKTVQQTTTQYVVVINFRRSGKPVVREVAVCQQHRTINKSTGGLITMASQAELADSVTGQKIARRFNLPYREFATRYSLRFDERLRLIGGFREQPRRAKALTAKQLKQIEQRLPQRRK